MQLLPHRSVSVPDTKFLAHPFDLHFGSGLQQEKIQVTLKEGYSPYIDARWEQWVTSAFRSMGETSVNRLGKLLKTAMIIMFIHECEWQTKREEKLFLRLNFDPFRQGIHWVYYAVGAILLAFLFRWDWSRRTMSPSKGHQGSLNGWTSMQGMWITNYGPGSHQILTQLTTYGKFWANVLHRTIQHHLKTGRIVFVPPVEFQKLVEYVLALGGGLPPK